MVSTKQELQSIGKGEGVVLGSVFIQTKKGPKKESPLAFFFKGEKANAASYSVMISKKGSFGTSNVISVAPDKEEFFIKKLPAGEYTMYRIQRGHLHLDLKAKFKVVPQQTIYLGRLNVGFPNRIRQGSPARTSVSNARQKTINHLRPKYGKAVSNVRTRLLKIEKR